MNLGDMRTRVRRDLKDEDAASYRWTDDELSRHIDHSVRELSQVVPLETRASLTTTAGSREVSISSLSDMVAVEAVEYPTGLYPPSYTPFSLWGSTLTLLVDKVPGGGESLYVYYGKLHTLDASTSTIPSPLEDLVAIGSEAYAALEWASYATNRVNLGGGQTPRNYLVWGQERLAAFHQGLAQQAKKNALRARQLYRPYQPKPSQSTDWGP